MIPSAQQGQTVSRSSRSLPSQYTSHDRAYVSDLSIICVWYYKSVCKDTDTVAKLIEVSKCMTTGSIRVLGSTKTTLA